MTNLERLHTRIIGFALGAVAMFIVGASQAQSIPQPPALSIVDANDVNLATGLLNLPGLEVGIGAGGSGLGRNSKAYLGTDGAVYDPDNIAGTIRSESIQSFNVGGTPPVTAHFLLVSYNGVVHRFRFGTDYSDGNGIYYGPMPYWEAGNINGASLTCSDPGGSDCTLTLIDGTSVVYVGGSQQSATKLDGEVITLTYFGNQQAVNTVSSTLGWTLKYTVDGNYKVTGVTAVNTSAAPCSASACSVASSFPSATMTINGATRTISRNGVNVVSYTVSGNTVTIFTPDNVTKTVTLSGGKVASVTAGGSTWNYSYGLDASGYSVTTLTAPNGTSRKIATQNGSVLVYEIDEANRKTSYLYDGSSRVVKAVAPDGNAQTGGYTEYIYDYLSRVTEVRVVPKGGASGGNANAGSAMVTKAVYFTCDATTNVYCKQNKPHTTTDANGVVTTYGYDATHGNLISSTTPAVGGVSAQTRYSYGQLTPRLKDAGGNLVNQAPVWRLTQTSSCMSSNWNGSACAGGTTDERRETISYTTTNLLPVSTTVSRGDGSLAQTSTVAYNDNGWVLATDGPKPGAVDETYVVYDGLGRQVGAVGIDPDGSGPRKRPASRTRYNTGGQVDETLSGTVGPGTSNNVYSGGDGAARQAQAQSDWSALTAASGHVQTRATTQFDAYGRAVIARYFIGTAATAKDVTQQSYDNMQRTDCVAIRLNSADFTTPPSACSLGTTLPDGSKDRIVKYAYDTVGNVTSTTSAYGTALARADFVNVYDIGSATSTGTLTSVADAKGNKTGYYYDSFNRLFKTCYPTASNGAVMNTSDCELVAYRTSTLTGTSQAGTLAQSQTLRPGSGTTISFGYDALGRLNAKSGAVSESLSYNNFGQVVSRTNNTTGGAAATSTYGWFANGWLANEGQPLGAVSYAYDAYGKRTQLTWPGGFYVNYSYNDGDELTGIYENGTTQIASFGYDNYGRRTTLGRGNGQTTGYGYDAALRLQSLSHPANAVSLSYSEADQIRTRTNSNSAFTPPSPGAATTIYGADGLNRMTMAGSASLGYDLRGNMTSDGAVTFGYNANNLLTTTSAGASLAYDAENRLARIARSGYATTRFLYDGVDVIAEYDDAGTVLRRYVHGPGMDEPLVWYEGSGTGDKRYYHADPQGSVTQVTNGSGGSVGINRYDEYGLPAGGNVGRFQYTGQMWLPEVGLYYYKARMYAPSLGRFMQTDPIGYADGMNWYAYVGNDPVNKVDPFGLQNCFNAGRQATSTNTWVDQDGLRTVENIFANLEVCFSNWNDSGWSGGGRPGGYTPQDTIIIPKPCRGANDPGPCEVQPKPNPWMCQKANTGWGKAANVADDISVAAGVASIGFGGVALVTSETVFGGIGFGALAAGSAITSTGAGVASVGFNLLDGRYGNAATDGFGLIWGGALQKAQKGLKPAMKLTSNAAGETGSATMGCSVK